MSAADNAVVVSTINAAVEARVLSSMKAARVAASEDTALADAAVAALHSDSLRIYTSTDVIGVEVGGAVKNVLTLGGPKHTA